MLADQLNIYFSGRPGGAPPSAGPASPGRNWGDVQRLVAEGNVFFVSPTQTARGQHAVYEVVPDTITMTGDVVVVTGENVVKGDKLIIEVKTGHATIVSDTAGRNQTQRVRGVFYSSPSPAPWRPSPHSCCWTSPSRGSTPWRARTSAR